MNKICLSVILTLASVGHVHAVTFDQWKMGHFTEAERGNPLISGDTADPDNDQIVNLLEYAQGRNPRIRDSGANPLLTVSKAPGGALTVSHPQLKGAEDIDCIVEASPDMLTWNGGYGKAWTTEIIDNGTTETVTSVSRLPASTHQFMRLKVVRSPRAAILASITTANPATNNNPVHLLDLCTVKTGPFAGAIVRYPMRPGPNSGYEEPNYVVNWYLANILLSYFVETEQARVLNYMNVYLREVDELEPEAKPTQYRIRDVDLLTSNFGVWQKYHADSDDAYAGTFLYLVGKYRRLHGDQWFRANKVKLKNIAYHNILQQIKGNGLTQTFQGGRSNNSDNPHPITGLLHTNNAVGYLMDNVQAWAGLKELVAGLVADPSEPQSEILYYSPFVGSLEAAIHSQLWDETSNCWKPADTPLAYEFNGVVYPHAPFYPFVQCQYFPQLYALPYANNPVETQRRYNMGWTWLEQNMRSISGVLTPWEQSDAWWSVDAFSHIDIAVVAAKRGEVIKVNSFLQMAAPRWLPGTTSHTGTPCDQIGYWHVLTSP
ncbi:MAG: hypothetical protein ACO1TE_18725 [Prosthecobacter sp.]